MLTSFYDQILFMSAAGSVLYLVYTLSSEILRSKMSGSFGASWQYYSSLIIYSFFVIPYFMLESLLSVVREPANFTDFSVLNIVTELTDNEEIRVQALNYAGLFYEFLPFILIIGTLIYIIVVSLKSRSLKLRNQLSTSIISLDLIFRLIPDKKSGILSLLSIGRLIFIVKVNLPNNTWFVWIHADYFCFD